MKIRDLNKLYKKYKYRVLKFEMNCINPNAYPNSPNISYKYKQMKRVKGFHVIDEIARHIKYL